MGMGRCMHPSSGERDKVSPGMECHPLSVLSLAHTFQSWLLIGVSFSS